jgi:hypothetical protein
MWCPIFWQKIRLPVNSPGSNDVYIKNLVFERWRPSRNPGGPSIFEAVEKQLGLKLEKGTHPMPVIVIDHAEERPVD